MQKQSEQLTQFLGSQKDAIVMYELSSCDSSETSCPEQSTKIEVSFINQAARDLLKSQGRSDERISPEDFTQETEFEHKRFSVTEEFDQSYMSLAQDLTMHDILRRSKEDVRRQLKLVMKTERGDVRFLELHYNKMTVSG